MSFSFKEFTGKEKKAIAKKNKEIKEATEATAEALRECIGSDTFKKYKEELSISDKALMARGIDILKTVRNKDERLALYDALFVRADVLSLLLRSIDKDRV